MKYSMEIAREKEKEEYAALFEGFLGEGQSLVKIIIYIYQYIYYINIIIITYQLEIAKGKEERREDITVKSEDFLRWPTDASRREFKKYANII